MLEIFLTIFLVIPATQGCQPAFPPLTPSIYEQSTYSGTIIQGLVHKIENGEITLKKSKFLKGCGPRTVVIKGFSGVADCGVDLPSLKSHVIVFVCQDSPNRRWWTLNKYVDFAGSVPATLKNKEQVNQYLHQNEICENCCSFISKCLSGANERILQSTFSKETFDEDKFVIKLYNND